MPCKQYLKTRMLKLISLNNLSNEKKLPAEKRKKYRAQKFALQKRIEVKLLKMKSSKGRNLDPELSAKVEFASNND